jgi:hypothetical protein
MEKDIEQDRLCSLEEAEEFAKKRNYNYTVDTTNEVVPELKPDYTWDQWKAIE